MAKYQPPDKQSNRKRNKTGYNMFFTYHVNHLKTSETGVPSERGSVARMVGNVSMASSQYSSSRQLISLRHGVLTFNSFNNKKAWKVSS